MADSIPSPQVPDSLDLEAITERWKHGYMDGLTDIQAFRLAAADIELLIAEVTRLRALVPETPTGKDAKLLRLAEQLADDAISLSVPAGYEDDFGRGYRLGQRDRAENDSIVIHGIWALPAVQDAPKADELQRQDYAAIVEAVEDFFGFDITTREQQNRITRWATALGASRPSPADTEEK